MPFRQIIQSVWHAGNDLDRMFGNGMGETVYRLVQRGCERLDRQLLECPNQGVSEAVQAISVRDDRSEPREPARENIHDDSKTK